MPRFYILTLSVLAVWRITHLLQAEDGPSALLARLRALAGAGFLGQLLDCFNCLSLWVGALFAWFSGGAWAEKLLLWPALSGAAILLERITARPIIYVEDPEPNSLEDR